jgi:mono/diheme cytochrome c family protein
VYPLEEYQMNAAKPVLPFAAAIWLAVACAPRTAPPTQTSAAAAGADLPAGRGRDILFASCTSCHDLREVTKFRGYYNRAQWRDIVVTMVEYGAAVTPPDVDLLADYLDQHLGRRPTASSP